MNIPKISAPLAKSIRTGEGILVYATNVVLAVAALLPDGLSWTHAGLYLAILNGVHVLSRTLLKVAAVQSKIGIGAPDKVQPISVAHLADMAHTIIQAVEDIIGKAKPAGGAKPVAAVVPAKSKAAVKGSTSSSRPAASTSVSKTKAPAQKKA